MESTQRQREFGRRVRRRRMALGLLQKDLAERVQMPQGHISRLEQGEFRGAQLETLARLADVLHTSVDFLLARSNDAGPVPDLLDDMPQAAPPPQTKRQRSRKAAPVA